MKSFIQLFLELDQTNSSKAKTQAIARYLGEASDADKLWCIALLAGKRPKRAARSTDIREWTASLSGIPDWLFEETYHVVGDLAETVAKLLPKPTRSSDHSLDYWMQFIIELGQLAQVEKKQAILSAWSQLDAWECFVFNKMMMGGYRVGVSQKTMVKALALATGNDEAELAHRLMGDWKPMETTYQELILTEDKSKNISRPYPFYLAYQLESIDDLGAPEQWLAERKWDGIRGQLIVREGQHFLWSRGEELINEKFPEFESLAEIIPDGTVIDGEILAYKDGRILPFQHLQTRIGRKNLTVKILQQAPAVLRAYDLLEWQGKDLRQLAQYERRQYLEKLMTKIPASPHLQLSATLKFNSWDELAKIRETSREDQCEGLMLKHKKGRYQVGRKKGDWWKWKVDPLTIDAVLIYAMRGHGRRANLYTDYTFGVWQGDELIPFAKAYSGLTDIEFRKVDQFVKAHTLKRFGPVRSVKPELVFELAFEGIQKSSRHKSGVALRFPRMKRWRTDKPVSEANTLKDLENMLQLYGS